MKRVSAAAVVLVALLAGAPAAASASGPRSLTTQFPLGGPKLCCARHSAKRGQRTGAPRRGHAAVKQTSAPHRGHGAVKQTKAPARGRGAGSSPATPTTSSHGHGVPTAAYLLGPPAVALLLILAQMAVSTVLRRRRRGRAAVDPALSPPRDFPPAISLVSDLAAAQNGAGARAEAMVAPEATVTDTELINDEAIVRDALKEVGSGNGRHDSSPAWRNGGAPSVRRTRDGGAAYRIGQMLYDRGRFEAAAAAWRLAASKQHARAAIRLGMMCEERGDLTGARRAYEDAWRLGDPAGAHRSAALSSSRRA